jgi:hypothetical protein
VVEQPEYLLVLAVQAVAVVQQVVITLAVLEILHQHLQVKEIVAVMAALVARLVEGVLLPLVLTHRAVLLVEQEATEPHLVLVALPSHTLGAVVGLVVIHPILLLPVGLAVEGEALHSMFRAHS